MSEEIGKAVKDDPAAVEISGRIESLRGELEKDRGREHCLTQLNYYFALLLMGVTLVESFVAGLRGIFFGLSGQITGGIAVLPSITGLAVSAIDWPGRANWHYRKKDELDALRRRLQFELPVAPSADNIAAISADRSKLDREMTVLWEKQLGLNWSVFKQATKQGDQPPPLG